MTKKAAFSASSRGICRRQNESEVLESDENRHPSAHFDTRQLRKIAYFSVAYSSTSTFYSLSNAHSTYKHTGNITFTSTTTSRTGSCSSSREALSYDERTALSTTLEDLCPQCVLSSHTRTSSSAVGACRVKRVDTGSRGRRRRPSTSDTIVSSYCNDSYIACSPKRSPSIRTTCPVQPPRDKLSSFEPAMCISATS